MPYMNESFTVHHFLHEHGQRWWQCVDAAKISNDFHGFHYERLLRLVAFRRWSRECSRDLYVTDVVANVAIRFLHLAEAA